MQYELVAQSLIEFKAVDFTPPPKTDWIFFYSKNAVRFFLSGLTSNLPPSKYACMGKGTTHLAKAKKLNVQFIGNGKPKATAQQFLQVAEGQSVLFPRANRSKKSIQRLLKNKIEAYDLIVYENEIKKEWEVPDCDILVFTSPLNAKAYFSKYLAKAHQKIIAIGNTTGRALKKLGVKEMSVAKEPSEKGLWEVLSKLTD